MFVGVSGGVIPGEVWQNGSSVSSQLSVESALMRHTWGKHSLVS